MTTNKSFNDMVADVENIVRTMLTPAPKLTRRQRIAKKAKAVVLRALQTFVMMLTFILLGSLVAMVVALAVLLVRTAVR